MPHRFRKESGPGLSKEVDLYIGQALDVARPQLGLIKEEFFNGALARRNPSAASSPFPWWPGTCWD